MLKYCVFFLSYYRLVGRSFIFSFLRCIKNVLFFFVFYCLLFNLLVFCSTTPLCALLELWEIL